MDLNDHPDCGRSLSCLWKTWATESCKGFSPAGSASAPSAFAQYVRVKSPRPWPLAWAPLTSHSARHHVAVQHATSCTPASGGRPTTQVSSSGMLILHTASQSPRPAQPPAHSVTALAAKLSWALSRSAQSAINVATQQLSSAGLSIRPISPQGDAFMTAQPIQRSQPRAAQPHTRCWLAACQPQARSGLGRPLGGGRPSSWGLRGPSWGRPVP